MEKKAAVRVEKSIKKVVAAVLVVAVLIALWNSYGDRFFAGDRIRATGTIEATTVKITSALPGTIGDLHFTEGDSVAKGDVVATIIRDDLEAQLVQNEASLAKAEQILTQVQAGAGVQQMATAEAAAATAYENQLKAAADLKRFQSLYEEGAVPLAELERYQTAYNISRDNYGNAQSQLAALRSSGGIDAQIGSAKADVERAKAALASVRSQIDDLTLTSPIGGILTSKNYEQGEFAQAGASIVTIADLEDLWIRVYVTTEELPKVILGSDVGVTVSGHDGEFSGKVLHIATQGEYTPKTVLTENERANVVFAVKIGIDSAGGILKPGMPADVVFAPAGGGQ